MPVPRPRRLRTAAVTTALVAGLALTFATLPATATATSTNTAAAGRAASAAGSASGFLFYVYPDPEPTCSLASPLGLNASGDPSIDRDACAFLKFTGSDVTGPVKADLYSNDAATPFTTVDATESSSTPGSFSVDLLPDATWPAGTIRAVIKDGAGQIGEYPFVLNGLRATLDAGAATAPGEPFTVTGTIEEHSARTTFSDAGAPAQLRLQTVRPDGTVSDTQTKSAASDGTFTFSVPGTATAGLTAGPDTDYRTSVTVRAVDASYTDPSTGEWKAATAATDMHALVVPATNIDITDSFVSSVGWVKPGDRYPSRVILRNPTSSPLTPTVDLSAPAGTAFLSASGAGTHPVAASGFTWSPGAMAPGATSTLVLESQASSVAQLSSIVWRDLSSKAVLHVPTKSDRTVRSHGPKVIPPSSAFDTARYGDRPFPVVPLEYNDRSYQAGHSGDSLESVLNDSDPGSGSTFNLYQEMSLGQLFPEGTVPSKGIASADFTDFSPKFPLTTGTDSPNTCHGFTYTDLGGTANPLYSERITNGVYNLPGNTDYYGDDSNGSALIGAETGQGSLQQIDSGCGPTGKIVADAVALADPEIDYSDYDTDKDGVVDFFMGVFAGCGGNGASQLAAPGDPLGACPYDNASYDNVWPHSSSLEYSYSDPATGLPGVVTNDQLKNLEGQPLWYTDTTYSEYTTTDKGDALKVFVRVGPYNLNPETAIDFASVISHEYGHSLGLPDFYSTGNRATYGDWMLMATDKSQNMDAYGRQELGWVVPEVLDKSTSRTVSNFTDSKQDTGTIHWQTKDGTPYVLHDGADGVVHNSLMYVAKLPGRQLLDASDFDSGDKATKSHLWWSGSGNDFGCTPAAGRNFDLAVPGLKDLPAGTTLDLSFKSRWDMEWDYDYGFVMTTTDAGKTYHSHASKNNYTTSPTTDPTAASNNVCQDTYSNGLTGSSGSYQAGTYSTDRKTDTYPPAEFLADSYDVSDLVGTETGAIRFSYATDPGLARPGWYIDDVKVTATLPDNTQKVLLATDFESDGGPDDPRVYNGGCREDLSTAQKCTLGWKYLQAGAESVQDHAYYLEMRDRSGFDLDGRGQADRGAAGFQAGLYLAYTDEAHGYGNVGTDDPPAQSPLDATPTPGSETPNLDDAAFRAGAGRSTYSDSGEGHTDNYTDPSNSAVDSRYASVPNPWRFRYDCLGFKVNSMSGENPGPATSDGDLTGNVDFTMGSGCGTFDYGYTTDSPPATNSAPTARAHASPASARTGQRVDFTAKGSDDAETPDNLDYSWDFGDGGSTKDAAGVEAHHAFDRPGTYDVTVLVTDPGGATDTATVRVTVADGPGNQAPRAKAKVVPTSPYTHQKTRLSGVGSKDSETPQRKLVYRWNFGDGGAKVDAVGRVVKTRFDKAGYRTVTLTVTDPGGKSDTVRQRVLVRREIGCGAGSVTRHGSWRMVHDDAVRGDSYCDNGGRQSGKDTLTTSFDGPQIDLWYGTASRGGTATVLVDGVRLGTVSFHGSSSTPELTSHQVFKGLGAGRHTIRLVVNRGRAYVEGFGSIR
ncbi:MAG: domain containing protein [Nocardioides sp.]|nr:domain containing protein [Nocardioides sp.]